MLVVFFFAVTVVHLGVVRRLRATHFVSVVPVVYLATFLQAALFLISFSGNTYRRLALSLANMKPVFPEHVDVTSWYIPRRSLEAQILRVYDTQIPNGDYHVVYGPKGAGKSSLVASALGDKQGVLVIPLSQGDTDQTLLSKIFRKCKVKINTSPEFDDFDKILRDAKDKRNGRPITFVFEVERGSSAPEVLTLIKHIAKRFALNANVLIVLSEANAVLGFGDDLRQNFIWVNELTREEAIEYMKNRNLSLPEADLNRFIEMAGALPLTLRKFADTVTNTESVDPYIAEIVGSAQADLIAFLHKPILKALKESPNGVNIKAFDGVEHKGVLLSEPRAVAAAMKIRNAILYHFGSREYRLFSAAHKTALRNYVPPE
jgi:hypothetical protein